MHFLAGTQKEGFVHTYFRIKAFVGSSNGEYGILKNMPQTCYKSKFYFFSKIYFEGSKDRLKDKILGVVPPSGPNQVMGRANIRPTLFTSRANVQYP